MTLPFGRTLARALLAGLAACSATLGAGCITRYQLVPTSGEGVARSVVEGVRLQAEAGGWSGRPRRLERYVTVLSVEVANERAEELVVRYEDIALEDERGFRFTALDPNGAGALPLGPRRSLYYVSPGLLSPYDSPWRGYYPYWRGPYRGYYGRGRYGRGFLGSGPWLPRASLRGPWLRSPWGYSPYWSAGPWGPSRVYLLDDDLAFRGASRDMLRLGLAEGVLSAGGRTGGFVYFPKAAQRAKRLFLVWQARNRDGAVVASPRISFDVAVVD